MDEFQQAIEHERQQIAAALSCLPAQFLPGIPETPDQRHLRRLRECGVFSQWPNYLTYSGIVGRQ